MRSRTNTQSNKLGLLIARLFGFAMLLVGCFLAGFFLVGPAVHKTAATEDLRVQAPAAPPVTETRPAPHHREPAVQVIERKLPTPEPAEADSQPQDDDIKLEIEQPVPTPAPELAVSEQNEVVPPEVEPGGPRLYRVEIRGFADETEAGRAADALSERGYAPIVNRIITDQGTEYRVQVGAFRNKDNADRVADDVRAAGLDAAVAGGDE